MAARDIPVWRGYARKLTFDLTDADNGDAPFALQPGDDVVLVVWARDGATEILRKTRADMADVDAGGGVTALELDLSEAETALFEIGRVNPYEIGFVRGGDRVPLLYGFFAASLRGV